MKPYYTEERFPYFLMNHGNWNIHCDAHGTCACLAIKDDCESSHFGGLKHVERVGKMRGVIRNPYIRYAAIFRNK